MDLCPSARGHFDIQIEFEGRAAHGGTPESGLNATLCAAAAVQRIGALEPMTDVTVGANSATPTIITAGERANQVPDSATLVVDYRPIPGETEASVQERIADALVASACTVTIDMYPPGARLGPFKTSHDHRYVRVMQQTASAVRNEPVAVHSFPAATEAAFFDPLMPTIVFGPGQIADGETPIAHSKDEYVRASSVQTAAAVLEAFLEEMVVDAEMALLVPAKLTAATVIDILTDPDAQEAIAGANEQKLARSSYLEQVRGMRSMQERSFIHD